MTNSPEIQDLEQRVKALEQSVAIYRQGLTANFERLKLEIETQKKLSRYARRTWFEMMAYIFIVGMLVADIARAYADSQWWGLVFWTTQHGDGGPMEWTLRAIGLGWQVALLYTMGRRSQVPDWVYDRTPDALDKRRYSRRG